jgi:ribosomal protein S18 acetylase RimI-like enzyme
MDQVFQNEELVWAARGGRPAEETLRMFQGFLSPSVPSSSSALSPNAPPNDQFQYDRTGAHHGNPVPYGGVLILAHEWPTNSSAGADHWPALVGYCVGDFIAADEYEVATAWVHPHYRGLDLAIMVSRRERGLCFHCPLVCLFRGGWFLRLARM